MVKVSHSIVAETAVGVRGLELVVALVNNFNSFGTII